MDFGLKNQLSCHGFYIFKRLSQTLVMSIRKFVFCDVCNPQALRSIEFRRSKRAESRTGRRISDGRSWFEGEPVTAVDAGWLYTADGRHICPACREIEASKEAIK